MHCCFFVLVDVVVIGCGNCGLWHISCLTAKRLEAVSALRVRVCVCMLITSLRQYLGCAALHLHVKVEFDFLLLFSVFKLEQQQARALTLIRSYIRDLKHTQTHTHADIHNINRQTFIAGGGCLKSRYTYVYLYTCLCLYVYFLCFLTFVIKCDQFHVIIHVLKGLPRTVAALRSVWVSQQNRYSRYSLFKVE